MWNTGLEITRRKNFRHIKCTYVNICVILTFDKFHSWCYLKGV